MKQTIHTLLVAALAFMITAGCHDTGDETVTAPGSEKPTILVGHIEGDEKDLPEGIILHEARDCGAPERVIRQPIVSDDPEQIAACRRTFEQRIHEIHKQALTRIRQGEWLDMEHTHALNEKRTESLEALHTILADGSAEPRVRVKAAQMLAVLKDTEGEEFLLKALRSGPIEMRRAALNILTDYDSRSVDLSRLDRAAILLSLLADEDEQIVQAAAGLCSSFQIPGIEAQMLAVLKGRELQNPGEFALKLAKVASTRETVDAILPHITSDLPDKFPQHYGYVFDRLLHVSDASVREPVRKTLHEIAMRYPNDRYDQSLVRELAITADQDAIPILEDIRASAKDPVSRAYAVEALARLQPDRAIELVLGLVESQGHRPDIIRELRKYANKSDYDRIMPAILSSLDRTGKPMNTEIVCLCLNELGERGRAFVHDRMDVLDDNARMWAQWQLQNIDLRTALSELHGAGVISASPDELLAKIQEADRKNSRLFDPSDPNGITIAFALDQRLVTFDAETSTIPCHHDQLILTFAECTGDRFRPQWPVQFWHQEQEDDYDAPYTLQFVYHGRLFRIGAENYGDWYDVESVIRLLNFALETTGQRERFIGLASDGQCPGFVYSDPNAMIPIANRYGLPLSEDPSSAMRQGIEFERRVIDSMEK